jgi:hypothetical protein
MISPSGRLPQDQGEKGSLSSRDLAGGDRNNGHMPVTPDFGDIPTWIASLGTVGALIVAFVQINTERRRRHESEEETRVERHFAQARLISAVMGPEEQAENLTLQDQRVRGQTAVDLINSSPEPVYMLVIGIVFILGPGPHTIEEMCKLAYPQDQEARRAVTTASVLPGGTYRVWLHGVGWSHLRSGRFGVEVAFTDRIGNHWIRRATGHLEELREEPFKYFAQCGMSAPYDLQTPVRLM